MIGRRRTATASLGAIAATLSLVLAGTARADDVQCAPKDAWCIAVFHKKPHNRLFLDFFGFEIRGRYRLCVTPPDGSATCKRFRLRLQAENGAYVSSVLFTRNFPHRARGRYEVRWSQHDRQVGRTLTFRW